MIRKLIPDGARGTRATLSAMARLAEAGSKTEAVRNAAVSIISGVPARDYAGEASAVHDWVRCHVRFVRDPVTAELVQTPRYTLAHHVGDCDDQATLIGALLMSIGIPARFQAAGADADFMQHVWAEAFVNGKWMPLDTAAPQYVAPGQYAEQTRALPVRMLTALGGCDCVNGATLGDLPGLPSQFQAYAKPRGLNPYPGFNTGKQSTVFDFQDVELTPDQIAYFLAPGKAQPLLVAAMAERMSPFPNFLNAFTANVAPWAAMIQFEPGYSGPATSPPIPVNDIYIPNVSSCGYSGESGGGGGGGFSAPDQSRQMAGLGDTVTNPCNPNQKGNAIMLPGGGAILEGNTNGYYIDWLGWFVWALQNKKVQVTAAWMNSSKHSDWFNENIADPHGLLNRIAPPLINALVIAGVTMGIASGVSSAIAANTASGTAASTAGGTIPGATIGGGLTAGGLPATSITVPGIALSSAQPVTIAQSILDFSPSLLNTLPPVGTPPGLTPGGLPATNITPPPPNVETPPTITGPGIGGAPPSPIPGLPSVPPINTPYGQLPGIGAGAGLPPVEAGGNLLDTAGNVLNDVNKTLPIVAPFLPQPSGPHGGQVQIPPSSGAAPASSGKKSGMLFLLLAAAGVALFEVLT